MARRLNRWQRVGRQLSRAWREFRLEGDYLKLDLPDEIAAPSPPPPGPPGSSGGNGPVDYDDLQRRVMARLRSWRLGSSVDHTDAWMGDANWVKVRDNVEEMHELDLRQILSMSREEFRAAASRYAPYWYH